MRTPSVTKVIGLLNKPALISWANKLGLNGVSVKSYSSQSCESGTKKHQEIEDFLLHGVCMSDPEIQSKVTSLFNGCQIISVEESFKGDKFKGRVDIRFIKDGLEYIGDFKTKVKRVYIENYLQLCAYRMHFGSDRVCLINLTDFTLTELDLTDYEKYCDIFNNLLNIYNIKNDLTSL